MPDRLVVEITDETDLALTELVIRDGMNKSTIVNRAVQLYRFAREADRLVINGVSYGFVEDDVPND